MIRQLVLVIGVGVVLFADAATTAGETPAASPTPAPGNQARQAKTRKFAFHYRFRVHGLEPAEDPAKNLVRIWLPCAAGSDCQEVARQDATAPARLSETKEARYGNPLLYCETRIPASGELAVDVPYVITRREVLRQNRPAAPKLDDVQRALLLGENRLVPKSGKPLQMLAGVKLAKDQVQLARQLYDLVDGHVIYKKEGAGWGRGDTNWVCDSGYGNCTDFHSLFMSLARSQGIPARFEIGFSIPTDKTAGPVVGYHCWAWFYADQQGWLPVDISEADKHPELKEYYFGNLTADRVMFSEGRDLELSPAPQHRPLNFLIYPYIEVGGKPLAAGNVESQFAFEDVR